MCSCTTETFVGRFSFIIYAYKERWRGLAISPLYGLYPLSICQCALENKCVIRFHDGCSEFWLDMADMSDKWQNKKKKKKDLHLTRIGRRENVYQEKTHHAGASASRSAAGSKLTASFVNGFLYLLCSCLVGVFLGFLYFLFSMCPTKTGCQIGQTISPTKNLPNLGRNAILL